MLHHAYQIAETIKKKSSKILKKLEGRIDQLWGLTQSKAWKFDDQQKGDKSMIVIATLAMVTTPTITSLLIVALVTTVSSCKG